MLYKPYFLLCLLPLGVLIMGCQSQNTTTEMTNKTTPVSPAKVYPTMGKIEYLDDRLKDIIPEQAVIERIAEGLTWAEGPLWVTSHQMLLFSDVKENKIFKWTEKDSLQLYLSPSGFTGENTDSREPGSNGLTLDPAGNLVMCQHANRQIARMDAPLDAPEPKFESLAATYDGKRLNSPNDLIYDSQGNLYFTDPPYGLSEKMMEDPKKELPFQGIYKLDTNGKIHLLYNQLSRPNGLALSKDEKTLYVANSDDKKAAWFIFKMEGNSLSEPELLYDATHLVGTAPGFPDGVKLDDKGNIFTAGPGGIWVFAPDHTLLGKINTEAWASNCNFNEDYSVLYITADDYVLRLRLH